MVHHHSIQPDLGLLLRQVIQPRPAHGMVGRHGQVGVDRARIHIMQTAPGSALKHGFELGQLTLGHVLIAQAKPHLTQDIVKPQTGLGVGFQKSGQMGNRILAVVVHRRACSFERTAVPQSKQQGHQGVDVIHINSLEAQQPRGGQHPSRAATDQQQFGLRGLNLR